MVIMAKYIIVDPNGYCMISENNVTFNVTHVFIPVRSILIMCSDVKKCT